MTGCCCNAYWVCLFDERGEPTGVWTGKAMMTEATGINHRAIYLYPTEDEAWRVVERHHKIGFPDLDVDMGLYFVDTKTGFGC